jgi:tetratricopeptide (TPR) repeat protein
MIVKKRNKDKEYRNIIIGMIVSFFLVIWLATPPGNKFMQIVFWGNNTQFFIAKLFNKADAKEFIYHRNNAILFARMDMKEKSLKEMDKAIQTAPTYISDSVYESLYKDRALLRIYYGDYKGALGDYLRAKDLDLLEQFRLALLYKQNLDNKRALSTCNLILATDSNAYSGFVCLAEVYSGVGRNDIAVRVFDVLIDRKPNRAQYYVDRAFYKAKAKDETGYASDIATAEQLAPNIKLTPSSLVANALKPKVLTLSIKNNI